MDNLSLFDKTFPNSCYREVYPQYEGSDVKEYQKSKAPMTKDVYTFEQIKNTKNRIGWIVPRDYVVVDLDKQMDARHVYDILKAQNVTFSFMVGKKGGHFIFKNTRQVAQGVKLPTSIGIQVDIRSQEKGYIILPHNDTDRRWGVIAENVDEIPFFLVPLRKCRVTTDFSTLGEGDGRNTALFEHIMALKDYADELSLSEKVSSIRIINTYLFKDPIDDAELTKTVLRDDVVNKPEDDDDALENKKHQSLERLAAKIIENMDIISSGGDLFIYNGKFYKRISDIEMEKIIHDMYKQSLLERDRREVIKFIKLKQWIPTRELDKNWTELVFKNGVLDLTTMKLYPHTPTSYHSVCIGHDYNDKVAFSPVIDTFLNVITAFDEERKRLIYEMIGYCFLRRPVFGKFFVLYGEGGTGKSTLLKLIRMLIGDEYIAYLGLADLEKPYLPAELFGKLVNIGDDIHFKGLEDTSVLKKAVTGEEITVRAIFKEPFSFSNFATLIFAANKLPVVSDRTSGFYRRMIIVELNTRIKNPDLLFLDKIGEADMEYLLLKSIEAIRAALGRNEIKDTFSGKLRMEEYKRDQSSVLTFCADEGYNFETLHKKSTSQIYAEYKNYAQQNGYKPLNKRNFQDDILTEFQLEIKNTTAGSEPQCWRFVSPSIAARGD